MQAPAYDRTKNFAENSPDRTDHAAINTELDNAAQSINKLRDNLALIQNDDGDLKSGIVNIASLSNEVMRLMTGTDVLTIEGPVGPAGASFNANYKGLSSERPTFNSQAKGFSFLAMDTGLMYFKLSDASGDWSNPYPFGKGDKGNDGRPGADGGDGADGADGLITAVDFTTKTVGLTGKSALNISASIVNGQLILNVSTT